MSINVVTLGCAKNVVDSEKIMGNIPAETFDIVHNSTKFTDIVLVNTCGFINDAKQQSIDTLLYYVEAKNRHKVKKVFATGCLAQRYKADLLNEIPELDGIYGFAEIPMLLKNFTKSNVDITANRIITTPCHYAYLKIAEGCDRTCSFCAIPFIRGKNVSIPIEKVLEEAQMLADKGVKELIVVAQDTTYYGLDLYKKRMLARLLEKLSDIKQFQWIRLHYAFPSGFPEDVLDIIQSRGNICKYLDIPLQHINDSILESMHRGIDSKGTRELLRKIQNKIPGIHLRTAFIVGYPGETAAQFKELFNFVKEQRFERLGVFSFSSEEGTAAAAIKPQIRESTKTVRMNKLMELQQQISFSLNQAMIGKTLKVLVDRKENDFYIARTEFDSPEIDNEVLIPANKKLIISNFYQVRIYQAEQYDLYAYTI
ncbi:MAG: 30S ribosomal protein S12 methylthiotransferase RimO [Bacteroidota bacterium]